MLSFSYEFPKKVPGGSYMRRNRKSSTNAVIALFLCITMIFTICLNGRALAYITGSGQTRIISQIETEIGKGVILNSWQAQNADGTPKTGRTITFNPLTSDAQLVVSAGSSTSSRKTLTALSKEFEKKGLAVIGGVNGDFYNLTTGVPIGVVVEDGRLISSNNPGWFGIGFKADGSSVIGTPDINIKGIVNGKEFSVARFNKAQSDVGAFLFSRDFGANTGSTVPSLEIIMNLTMGQAAIGKMVIATVSEIRTNATATPIGENQLVLSVRNDKPGYTDMTQIKVGDEIGFQFNDPSGKWTDVQQVVGGDKILIQNGTITSGLATKDYNPTSAIGVKANGEIVLYQVDGRITASQGASSQEIAQFLYDLGCVHALKLDGGGSSSMISRTPGYASPKIINTPSDGSERANANGILLISKQSMAIRNGSAQASTEATKIHIYPGTAYALPKGTIQLTALATDDYYLPAALPQNMIWGTDAGTIDANGLLTVTAAPGTYQIMAGGGYAFGTAQLTVLSTVTSLKPSKSTISVTPGSSIDLSVEAYYQGTKVTAPDNVFTWAVEGNIGSITQEGVFTAAQAASGKGRIVVSYGSAVAYVDVVFADTPGVIEDFENGSSWSFSTVRAKSGNVSVVEDSKLAKSGTKLLKIDYDFTLDNGVENGTAGLYAFRIDPNTKAQAPITLEKNPTAIGMWVYGDGGKTWLRAKVKDASGQSFDVDFVKEYRPDTQSGGIDFTGWKYLEAAIPAGKQGPFTLETPIRIMCSRDELRTKGTLYIDRISAVYGVGTQDTQAPSAQIQSPKDQAVFKAMPVPLNIQLSDQAGGSGINTQSIQVLMDGVAITNYALSINGGVTLTGELGVGGTLGDGLHQLTVKYADMAGNTSTSSVFFTVDTGAPQLIAESSPTFYTGGSFTTTLSIKNPKNLKKIYVSFDYDPTSLELVDADTKTSGKQIALEAWVKKGKIINHRVDEQNGKILIEIDNLTSLSSAALAKVGTMTFKAKSTAKDTTQVSLGFGAMLVANNKSSLRFILPSMTATKDFGLSLKASGTSVGETTSFTVTDRAGNPVEGAGIYLDSGSSPIATTDKSGKASTQVLTQAPVGTNLKVSADKGGLSSKTLALTISEKMSGLSPQNLSLSLTANPGSMSINYLTPVAQEGTLVQYMEKKSFSGTFNGALVATGTSTETQIVNLTEKVPMRVHSVTMKDLKPGTTYVYRLANSSGQYSTVYEFTTPNYDSSYSFAFITDPQATNAASYQVFGDVLSRAVEKAVDPAFILLGGDLADRGGNKSQWDLFFGAGARILSGIPVMAAPGNHEYYDDEALTNFTSYFSLPNNGPEGLGETSYSFQTKDALIFVLNTQKNMAKQLEWLEETCKTSDKKWKIVMMHRGIYSGFYDEADLRKLAQPVFDRVKIDLVLNGHDHTYIRTTMRDGKKANIGAGTTYITGGSSGKKYYDANPRTWTTVLYDANYPVFTTFRVYPNKMVVTSSHIESGKTVDHDRFEIVK